MRSMSAGASVGNAWWRRVSSTDWATRSDTLASPALQKRTAYSSTPASFWRRYQSISGERRAALRRSHPEGGAPGIAGLEIAVARHRPQRKELPVAVVAQIEHAREARGGEQF